MKKPKGPSEFDLLKRINQLITRSRVRPPGLVLGAGDDAAAFHLRRDQETLLTTDIQVEGRHFQRDWFSAYELGWKLAAVNISDIAAMGGRPILALLSLALPRDVRSSYVDKFVRGVIDHLAVYRAALAGGNISGIGNKLVADLTLVGYCVKGREWRRSCRPGSDAIVVVGWLGKARAGLEILKEGRRIRRYPHLVQAFKRPLPLLGVGKLLGGEGSIHGAIDVSDGFSIDLIRLCEAGGAGCAVDSASLPVADDLGRFCRDYGRDPLDWVLEGGEDYALILSVERGRAEAIAHRIERKLAIPARVVGEFTSRRGRYELLLEGSKRKRLAPRGWDHFASRGYRERGGSHR